MVSDADTETPKRQIKYKAHFFEGEVKKLKQKGSYYDVLNGSTDENPIEDNYSTESTMMRHVRKKKRRLKNQLCQRTHCVKSIASGA